MSKNIVVSAFFITLMWTALPSFAQCTGGPQNISWNGWTFSFVRPCLTQSTTSGGNGGGIEIRNAKYKGRLVFTKAHTPILNVKYRNDACGPYRDWQYQESVMQCTNVTAPGRCDGPVLTNCDTGGNDTGSFTGVAVMRTPSELTLTTNVQAGWYRYIIRWHFFPDGTFHPDAYFGAVPASCVTNPHLHMIYFRVDLDVESDANAVEEHNDYRKVIDDGTTYWYSWDPIFVETMRMRQQDGSRWWRVVNRTTSRAYLIYPPELFPGGIKPNEDEYDIVPQMGDIWFLKYNALNQEETADGGSFSRYWAHLNQFISDTPSEFPDDQQQSWDVVVWYAGGTLHQVEASNPTCHVVQGPYFTPDPKGTAW